MNSRHPGNAARKVLKLCVVVLGLLIVLTLTEVGMPTMGQKETMSNQNIPLSSLHLFVKDMSATLAFYRRVGLSIPEDSVFSAGGKVHHVEVKMPSGFVLELDSVELTKAYDKGWQLPTGPSRNLFVFSMPSRTAVDERYGDLTKAGYNGHLAPVDAFWGARYAVVEDPDGNQVGLMSSSDPDRRRPPPGL